MLNLIEWIRRERARRDAARAACVKGIEELERRARVRVMREGYLVRRTNHNILVNQGFTLLELLVSVGIVAILAAIAVPQYLSYTTRSRVSEALQLGAGAQNYVAEAYQNAGGTGTAFDTAVASWNTQFATPTANLTKYVAKMVMNDTATAPAGGITITLTDQVGGAASGTTIGIVPEAIDSTGDREPLSALTLAGAQLDFACVSDANTVATAEGFHTLTMAGTLPHDLAPSSCK